MKWYLLLIMYFLFAMNVYTQNVGIGTTTPTAKLHVKGGLYLEGASGVTPVSGPGNRLMWIPLKAAFRSGGVSGTQWDDANIGNYSTAMGYNSWASSDYSTSLGYGTTASGLYAIAMGSNSLASGEGSVAFGNSTSALGGYAFASGGFTGAMGAYSTAMGAYSISSGQFSSAFGYYTKSKSYGGVVIGTFNDSTNAANPLEFDSGNRLFQIGNGMSDDARNNAMTVLQSGDVGIGVLNPLSRLHVKKGGLLVDGTVGNTPMSGGGTRLMWIPIKAAFRAGSVDANQWDDSNIGNYSMAIGYNTLASNNCSIAMGSNTTASGDNSIALGQSSTASGYSSFAMGYSSEANDYGSFAIGYSTLASGEFSFSMGTGSIANGYISTAWGNNSIASGATSFATGAYSIASGIVSSAFGLNSVSKSFGGVVIGTNNDTIGYSNPSDYYENNRLFQIGNGYTQYSRSNAMTVLQNGNVGIGVLAPEFILDVNDRIRLRNNASSAGIWFNNNANTTSPGFFGTYDLNDNYLAMYGAGAGWNFYFNTTNGNVGLGTLPSEKLHVNGNGLFTGTVTASCGVLVCSDIRYKKNLLPVSHALSSILNLHGIYYNWDTEKFKDKGFTDERQIGFSAQELEPLFPEMVHTDANGYKSVDYSKLTPVLVEAMKEQQQQINDQQLMSESLQKQMSQQQDQIELLEKQVSILLEKINQK